MQNLLQALNNLINVAFLIATPILVIASIIASLNMARTDGGRRQKAKKQLIGITLAVNVIKRFFLSFRSDPSRTGLF